MFVKDAFGFFNVYFRLMFGKKSKYPVFVYLELSKKCNFHCKFCDIWRISPSKELSFLEISNLMHDCKKMGVKLFHLCGGEPTLHKDLLKIVEEGIKIELPLVLTTNGSMPLKGLIDAGLKNITMSLDSHKRSVHDMLRGVKCFDKAVESIRLLKENKLPVSVNCIIHKENYKELIDYCKFCLSLGVETINFLPIQKIYPQNFFSKQKKSLYFDGAGDLGDELSKLSKFLDDSGIDSMSSVFFKHVPDYYDGNVPKGYCSRGLIVCEVDSYGNVYPCYGNKKVVGNIKEESLSLIWKSKRFENARKSLKDCNDCWQNCQIEPMVRFKLRYLLFNFKKVWREYKRFVG